MLSRVSTVSNFVKETYHSFIYPLMNDRLNKMARY